MGGEFRLSIQLGNDAMCSAADIAGALRTAADRLERGGIAGAGPSAIFDVNGNSVGDMRIIARMESAPMRADELGRFVCVAHGGCLHSPDITIRAGGVWVKAGGQFSSAHRDCFEAWQAREEG